MSLAYFEYELDLHCLYSSPESTDSEEELKSIQDAELDKKFWKALEDSDLSTIKDLVENHNYDITNKFNCADTILDRIYTSSHCDNNIKFKILKYALQTSKKQKEFEVDDLQYGLICMLEYAPLESIKYLVEFKPEAFKNMQLYDHNLEDMIDNEQELQIREYLVEKGLKLES